MRRHYFHIHCGGTNLIDTEGHLCRSTADVLAYSSRIAREIGEEYPDPVKITIVDDRGQSVSIIYTREEATLV